MFAIYGTPGWANRGARAERSAHQGGRPPQLRLRRREAVQRQVPSRRHGSRPTRRRSPLFACGSPGTSRTTPSSCAGSTGSKGGRWVIQSAVDYAKICNAVYAGVKTTLLSGRRSVAESRLRAATTRRALEPAVRLAACVPSRCQARRDEALRRLRAPPVLRQAERDADHAAEGEDRRGLGQHRRPDQGARRACTARSGSGSPSTATRRGLRTAPSASRTPSRRATCSQAYGIARKNPRIDMMLWFLLARPARHRRVAVRPPDARRQEEARLHGVPAPPALTPR